MATARPTGATVPVTIPAGTTAAEAVTHAGLKLSGPNAIVAIRDRFGSLRDLGWVPDSETEAEPVALSSDDGLSILRHSTAHVLAQAVQSLFPEAKLGTGPAIADGFYYDFAVPTPFQAEDLERIEKRMVEIVRSGQRFIRRECESAQSARFEVASEPLKLELLDLKVRASGGDTESGGEALTMYDNVDERASKTVWSDLCRGPHLPTTSHIPAFRLTRSAAAYWRGDEANQQLQRIYGTAWPSKQQLSEHLAALEEAAKRDHRRIGEDLDLFAFSKEIGKGLPLWLPNGTAIRDELEGWARDTERRLGYQRVVTPHITRQELYYLSGHLPYYTDDLYAPIDIEGDEYYLRPMNCPHHHMVYKARPRSYRNLPYKIAEYGTVYRFERSGQLHGLMRARGFSQNDAHIYCTLEQAKAQFVEVMRMHDDYYRTLGITDFYMVLALPDASKTDKYHDDEEMWRTAEGITRAAMEESEIPFVEEIGGAAHYGPKVDFMIRAVTGKEFAASTNQVDLYTPTRFGLEYHDADGVSKSVAVIHRAPLGSHERFVAFLTEHFGGAFPVWLAPEQVQVIPVMPDVEEYAVEVRDVLFEAGFRADVDLTDGRLPAKVRSAVARKIPLIVVVGRREAADRSVTVRDRSAKEMKLSLEAFVEYVRELVRCKSLEGAGHLSGAPVPQ
ncbi:threonine--tRNA ligase [Pseudonocardia alni]|uniref:threonine--tRNA ligase n=1 Tax=Pseudonocardia alni TaxID=33907 RepID=UPI00280BFD7C|nr:threonine--tRNA ligase [Pseudonocardia alni]